MSCGALHNNLAVARDRKKIPGKSGQKIGPPEAMGLRIVWNGPIINEPCPERSCRGRTLWSVPPSDLLRALIWCRTRRRATRWALDLIMITRRPVLYSTASRWLVLDVRWSWFSVFCLFRSVLLQPFHVCCQTGGWRFRKMFRCCSDTFTIRGDTHTRALRHQLAVTLSATRQLIDDRSMCGNCGWVVPWPMALHLIVVACFLVGTISC